MKLIFAVKSVRQDEDGGWVLLEEQEPNSPGQVVQHQVLHVYTADPKEIAHWVSRIGKSMAFVVEDL